MPTETQWQSQLVKAVQTECGGYAIKLSSLQRYGTPDLLIQLPGYPACYIETKVVETAGTNVTINATPLQRETLRRIQQAGGRAAYWVLVNGNLVLVGLDPDQEYLRIGEAPHMLRERGRPWPIVALVHRTVTP